MTFKPKHTNRKRFSTTDNTDKNRRTLKKKRVNDTTPNRRSNNYSRFNNNNNNNNNTNTTTNNIRSRYEGSTKPISRYNSNNSNNTDSILNSINIKDDKSTAHNNNTNRSSRFNKDTLVLPKGPKVSTTKDNNNSNNISPNKEDIKIKNEIKLSYSIFKNELPTSGNHKLSIYERISQVGEGTYGKVYKAKNLRTNKLVALKKLRLENEKEGFPITSIREIKFLQSFNHENISCLKEIMCNSNNIFMIFDYSNNDLSGILLDKSLNLTININQCKHLFQQLLFGINYLHKNFILHRDIKGSNILIDNNGNLKITDFGLARKINDKKDDYTNRVITLWYRPPELLLGTTNYSYEVDIWSCGCILMELFNKTAIFQGTNEIDQLISIFKVFGTPNLKNWPNLINLPWFYLFFTKINENFIDKSNDTFKKVLPSDECISLAKKLLNMNPLMRITAEEALQSKFFTEEPLPEPLIIENIQGRHEFEVKQERKKLQKRRK